MIEKKIFCIGLPRTGTTSMDRALQTLGYRTKHNPLAFRRLQFEGVYSFPGEWDALTNFGEHTYPQLDQAYPNSKFILTLRDKDKWLDSIGWKMREKTKNETAAKVRIDIFGTHKFSRERYEYVYDLHCKNAKEYFRDRADDFLVVKLDDGDEWARLCAFLGVDVPHEEFPHVHTRRDIEERRKRKKAKRSVSGLIKRCARSILGKRRLMPPLRGASRRSNPENRE